MTLESLTVLGAIAWFAGATIWFVRSVRRGRSLTDSLARRYPTVYEQLGRPRPGYFDTTRRDRWYRFIMRREYRQLEDPALVRKFEEHRRRESRALAAVLSGLVAVGIAIFWMRRAA